MGGGRGVKEWENGRKCNKGSRGRGGRREGGREVESWRRELIFCSTWLLETFCITILSRSSAHGRLQLKRQKLRVGGYTENELKWFNYLRTKAHHRCEVSCQGVPNWLASSLCPCFVEASPTVEKAVLCDKEAMWAQRTSTFGFTTQNFCMVGGYTENLENCQNWGGGLLHVYGRLPRKYGIIILSLLSCLLHTPTLLLLHTHSLVCLQWTKRKTVSLWWMIVCTLNWYL